MLILAAHHSTLYWPMLASVHHSTLKTEPTRLVCQCTTIPNTNSDNTQYPLPMLTCTVRSTHTHLHCRFYSLLQNTTIVLSTLSQNYYSEDVCKSNAYFSLQRSFFWGFFLVCSGTNLSSQLVPPKTKVNCWLLKYISSKNKKQVCLFGIAVWNRAWLN